jgi:2-dehydropantoate 2-reductase
MCRQAPTRALVASIMEEALEIADAVGAEPSVSIEQRLEGAEKVGDHKPSTLQDLEAGKPLELAAIVDSVVELADLTGVPAPNLRAVSAASGLLAETLGLR